MVHNQKLIVSLKVKNKHLRDYTKDGESVVYLPFGEEYSIFIKNLHPERAVVDIDIDGRNAITGLVVNGNNARGFNLNSVELERFHDGDQYSGYKFKFIEKTEKVREHRGEGPEDGLITVTWKYEKPKPVVWNVARRKTRGGTILGDCDFGEETTLFASAVPQAGGMSLSMPANEDGITAEGSESYQSFQSVSVGPLEAETHSIVIKLKGDVGQTKPVPGGDKMQYETTRIKTAVTTRTRVTCKNCGTRQTSNNKFCKECGSNLLAQR